MPLDDGSDDIRCTFHITNILRYGRTIHEACASSDLVCRGCQDAKGSLERVANVEVRTSEPPERIPTMSASAAHVKKTHRSDVRSHDPAAYIKREDPPRSEPVNNSRHPTVCISVHSHYAATKRYAWHKCNREIEQAVCLSFSCLQILIDGTLADLVTLKTRRACVNRRPRTTWYFDCAAGLIAIAAAW